MTGSANARRHGRGEQGLDNAIQALTGLARSLEGLVERNAPPAAGGTTTSVELAKRMYDFRRRRTRFFDAALFGEPAFDILLDLYLAHYRGAAISVSSCCVAAAVPPTTAMRHIEAMEAQGLLERFPDKFDRRRTMVRLTPDAAHRMDRLLQTAE